MSPKKDRNRGSSRREHGSHHSRGENGGDRHSDRNEGSRNSDNRGSDSRGSDSARGLDNRNPERVIDNRSSDLNRGAENSRSSYNQVWTEHVSSSGKKYYYNSVCGISQWDKPADWVDPNARRLPPPNPQRENDPEAEHNQAKRRPNHFEATNYRDHHDARVNRNQHYPAHNDVQVLHDTDTSSGGSTPILDAASNRVRTGTQDPPLSMASALPRNLQHQAPLNPPVSTHTATAINHCAPPTVVQDNAANRHNTSLNVLLSKSKIDGIQNVQGTYGNFSGAESSPMLTPSLSKYVLNDLTKHVSGWPADVLERQAQKFSEEAYGLGDLQCMRVCTELKCARAVVRHMEIQATLQDQKMMYLRQLIDNVKDVKSQNSIINADP